QFETARQTLARAWNLYRPAGPSANEPAWERNVREFRETVAELNSRIRIYNLKAPASVFQRALIDADKVIQDIKQRQVSNE
ncbi:MAG: hypothetical protein ACRD8U_08600, partial [Pyrinomonadaceae bacterium]